MKSEMKPREQDIETVKALGHRESGSVNWSEEGGCAVYRLWDTLFLFSIKQQEEGPFEGTFQIEFPLYEAERIVDLAYNRE